jgi:thioredoxin-like negative regulator of GroEL
MFQDGEAAAMNPQGHFHGDVRAGEAVHEGLREEPLVAMGFQPVLVDLTADWPGRCKLTQWLGHAAQFNGGWCMCNMLGKSSMVRSSAKQCCVCVSEHFSASLWV